MAGTALVVCAVESVRVHAASGHHVVILQEVDAQRRLLPIWIGADQAQSIASRLAGIVSERPLTHDLLITVLAKLKARIDRAIVKDLITDGSGDGVFHGSVFVVSGGGEMEVDSRASDAIALAMRAGAPILVAESVFQRSGIEVGVAGDGDLTVFRAFIETLDDGPEFH